MNKKLINWILFAAVIALTVYVLKDIDFEEVYYLLRNTNLRFFFLSLLIFPISLFIWNIRFKYLLGKKYNVGFWFLFKTTVAGFFINTITPGSSIGGEPVRIYYLSKKRKIPVMFAVGAVLADKLFYISVFFTLSILSLLYLLFFVSLPGWILAVLEIILVGIFFLFFIMILFHVKRRKIPIKWITNRVYNLNSVKKGFKSKKDFDKKVVESREMMTKSYEYAIRSMFVHGIIFSVLYWVPLILSTYFLFFAFNVKAGIISVSTVVVLSFLIGDLSPSPGGIGLMESTMLVLYSSIGISLEVALAVALLGRIIYYLYYLGLGGICLASIKKDYKGQN